MTYAFEHEFDTLDSYQCFVAWTDEVHIDPGITMQKHIFREEGTRYEQDNLQEVPDLKGNKLHMAAVITYDYKSELIFYNDEHLDVEVQKAKQDRTSYLRRRPRRIKNQDEEVYIDRLARWEANIPPPIDISASNNLMTQDYYVRNILPVYDRYLRIWSEREGHEYRLQEDNDPSHGTRSEYNVVQDFRRRKGIKSYWHPAQSPDLNPIEGVWLILKERVKRHYWYDIYQLKEIIRFEWSRITQDEIRSRIRDMPDRVNELIDTGGERIKGTKW